MSKTAYNFDESYILIGGKKYYKQAIADLNIQLIRDVDFTNSTMQFTDREEIVFSMPEENKDLIQSFAEAFRKKSFIELAPQSYANQTHPIQYVFLYRKEVLKGRENFRGSFIIPA